MFCRADVQQSSILIILCVTLSWLMDTVCGYDVRSKQDLCKSIIERLHAGKEFTLNSANGPIICRDVLPTQVALLGEDIEPSKCWKTHLTCFQSGVVVWRCVMNSGGNLGVLVQRSLRTGS